MNPKWISIPVCLKFFQKDSCFFEKNDGIMNYYSYICKLKTKNGSMSTPKDSKIDVYICFSHKDVVDDHGTILKDSPVMQIVDYLNHAGFKLFFDVQGSLQGNGCSERILETIGTSDIFVFLSTKNSNESEIARREVAIADELGKTIIPVRVDNTPYHRSLWARIVDLNYCKYFANPVQGIKELETAIKNHQEKMRLALLQQEQEELQRQQKELKQRERQGRVQQLQAQIKEQQDIVGRILTESLELKKKVLAYQYELQSAELELQKCSQEESRLRMLIENLEHNVIH